MDTPIETPEERAARKKHEQAVVEGVRYKRKIAARQEKDKPLKPAEKMYSSIGI